MKARLAAGRRGDRSGRQLLLAAAASLLAHGCMAAAICVMPVGRGHDETAFAEDGDLDRPPVRITFVSMQPRTDPVARPDPLKSLAESLSREPQDNVRPEEEKPPAALAQAAPMPPTPAAPVAPEPRASPAAETPPPTAVAAAAAPVQAPAPAAPAPTAVAKAPGPTMPSGNGPERPQTTGTVPGGGKRGGDHAKGTPSGPARGRPNGPPGETARPPMAPAVRTGAEILDLPKPEYPPRSRRLGEEGVVLLEVEVLPDGRAGKVRVLQAPAYPRLVDAALQAIRRATFKPATLEGAAVASVVEVPIRFRLD